MSNYIGEISALGAGICYAVIAVYFEKAGKRVGSSNVTLTRTIIGLILLTAYNIVVHQTLVISLPIENFMILSLSGAIGFAIGDILLFEAFVRIGSRITMLIYCSVPFFTTILASIILNETMTIKQFLGMIAITIGIALVILKKNGKNVKINYSKSGVIFVVSASILQAVVNIMSKVGAQQNDPFSITQIRMISALVVLIVICILRGKLSDYKISIKNSEANKEILVGSIFGPFLGVSLSLLSLQYVNPGVASTLMSITPIILIPYAMYVKKESVNKMDIVGSIITFAGISAMFL